jgi:hypothetical protein
MGGGVDWEQPKPPAFNKGMMEGLDNNEKGRKAAVDVPQNLHPLGRWRDHQKWGRVPQAWRVLLFPPPLSIPSP